MAIFEASQSLYVTAATVVVAGLVWPMVRTKVRNSSRVKRRISLATAIVLGFWICTSTALRFAGGSDSEAGSGTASLVPVDPWGGELSARGLLLNGILSTAAMALIAHGIRVLVKSGSMRRRRELGHTEPGSGAAIAKVVD
jgi:hypothetical protein